MLKYTGIARFLSSSTHSNSEKKVTFRKVKKEEKAHSKKKTNNDFY